MVSGSAARRIRATQGDIIPFDNRTQFEMELRPFV